jgi:hypothetical protein
MSKNDCFAREKVFKQVILFRLVETRRQSRSHYNKSMDLFTHAMQDRMKDEAPLAARMRPRTLDEAAEGKRAIGCQ